MVFDENLYKAPFYDYDLIRREVMNFVNHYSISADVPIDIDYIVEFDLGMDVVPLNGLHLAFGIDSWLSKDLKTVYIDEDVFKRSDNRYRFSLAHEVGHFWLHGDFIRKFDFSNTTEWKEFQSNFPSEQYSWFETHAYDFAGLLLVPAEKLRHKFDEQISLVVGAGEKVEKFSNEILLGFITRRLGDYFQVSKGVVEKRIFKDGLTLKPGG